MNYVASSKLTYFKISFGNELSEYYLLMYRWTKNLCMKEDGYLRTICTSCS